MCPTRPVLLFDGDCRLCRFAARTVSACDGKGVVALLPFQDTEAAPLLAPLPEVLRHASWHLVERDGRVLSRADALGAVAELLCGRWTAQVARRLDGLYGVVARNRSRLGRLVPDGPAPRRYP